MMMAKNFPDKLYYKIGEVAELLDVRTSVLRFWESEFSFLQPEKSSTGQRLYSKNEVNLLHQIKQLLYEEKLTIAGVKKRISPKGRLLNSEDLNTHHLTVDFYVLLKEVREELKVLRSNM